MFEGGLGSVSCGYCRLDGLPCRSDAFDRFEGLVHFLRYAFVEVLRLEEEEAFPLSTSTVESADCPVAEASLFPP